MVKNSIVGAVLVLSLVGLSSQLNQVEDQTIRLIESTPRNFVLSGDRLNQKGWKCLTVNGQDVILWKNDGCEPIAKQMSDLSPEEAALVGIKNQLSQGGYYYDNSYTNPDNNNIISSDMVENDDQNQPTGPVNWVDNSREGVEEFQYSRNGLGMNVTTVDVRRDLVTFVYRNNQIQIKPIACLNDNEKQLLDKTREELGENKRKMAEEMQKMREQLDQEMAQMRQQMFDNQQRFPQDMMNMQQDLNSMFGPNFPFN